MNNKLDDKHHLWPDAADKTLNFFTNDLTRKVISNISKLTIAERKSF